MRRITAALAAALALPLAAARAEDKGGQKEFRDIFFTLLQQDDKLTVDQARKLLYALPDELRSIPAHATLEQIDALYRKHRPSELYTLGSKVPAMKLDWTQQFKHGPVLLVVVPGIFGEFIAHSPFEEAFKKQDTAFARQWHAKAAAAQGADKTDAVYSLTELKSNEKPITDVFDVTSVDDHNGHPLIKAIFLKPAYGSLETFGKLEDNAATYLRRLTKFFHIMGEQPFYLVGYSRGLTSALETAVEARAKAHWGHNVKGVVSLAGVVYGTPLADTAFTEGDPTHALITELRSLAAKLHELPPDDPANPSLREKAHLAHLIEQDWVEWAKTAAKIASIEKTMPKPDAGLHLEKLKPGLPGVRASFHSIKAFAWDNYKLIHWPNLHDHFRNTARFKKMLQAIYDGAEVLTTKSRLDWYKNHVIPADISLYAIGGTMADEARADRANTALFDGTGVCTLIHDAIAIFTDSIDFVSLRMNYYQLTAAGHGMELNDSQVPLQRIRFWPQLYSQLNPHQTSNHTYFLGVLGATHWGLAFPVAFDLHSHKSDPFPRATLMKAIGTFIGSHP